eukprot:163823-Prymnesium_polylepis.1
MRVRAYPWAILRQRGRATSGHPGAWVAVGAALRVRRGVVYNAFPRLDDVRRDDAQDDHQPRVRED